MPKKLVLTKNWLLDTIYARVTRIKTHYRSVVCVGDNTHNNIIARNNIYACRNMSAYSVSGVGERNDCEQQIDTYFTIKLILYIFLTLHSHEFLIPFFAAERTGLRRIREIFI